MTVGQPRLYTHAIIATSVGSVHFVMVFITDVMSVTNDEIRFQISVGGGVQGDRSNYTPRGV